MSDAANRMRASSTRRRCPGQGAQLLRQHPFGQAETRADPAGLAFGAVAAQRDEPLLQLPVATDRAVAGLVVGDLGHQRLLLFQIGEQDVQAAGREHPVAGQHVEIALLGILRQIADFAGVGDRSGIRRGLARQDAQGRGLARAVAADQPDAVAGLHAQVGPVG
ncbi:hypothetical protein MHEI_00090 [Mycobacterium heidelbergense]|nr:hypothetical protein MHEI_00090 [Mycobacterium heidelbergense]